MANIASSKKDARRSAARAVTNRSVKSAVKTQVTKFRRAASQGLENAAELAVGAVAALDRAASKGILHSNNAARRKSRLMKRLNAVGAAAGDAGPAKTKKAGGARTKPGPAAKSRSTSAAGTAKKAGAAKSTARPAKRASKK